TMVYGIIELINFAHGDVFMVGSFVALLILGSLGVTGTVAGPAVAIVMLAVLLGAMLATGLLGVVIERAAYRPLRHAPRLAPLMGMNINSTIALTFFIGSALAGVGGFVFGIYYNSVWFINGYIAGLKAFTAAVLGGIGNIAGAMMGGILIGLLESLSAQYVS